MRATRGRSRVPGAAGVVAGASKASSITSGITSGAWKGCLVGGGESVVACRGVGSGSENSGVV